MKAIPRFCSIISQRWRKKFLRSIHFTGEMTLNRHGSFFKKFRYFRIATREKAP
jgi:hypothetical protein